MPKRSIKQKLYDLVLEDDSPHWIALSFSIGLFFGILPLFGLQFIPLLIMMFALRMNKIATILGNLMVNWVTMPIIYALSFILGTLIMGGGFAPYLNFKGFTVEYLMTLFIPLFIGSVIVGGIISIGFYFIVKNIVCSARKKRRQQRAQTAAQG